MDDDAVILDSTDFNLENKKDGRIIATLRLEIGDGLQLVWNPNFPSEVQCRVLDGRKVKSSLALEHLELSTVSMFLDVISMRVQQALDQLNKKK